MSGASQRVHELRRGLLEAVSEDCVLLRQSRDRKTRTASHVVVGVGGFGCGDCATARCRCGQRGATDGAVRVIAGKTQRARAAAAGAAQGRGLTDVQIGGSRGRGQRGLVGAVDGDRLRDLRCSAEAGVAGVASVSG